MVRGMPNERFGITTQQLQNNMNTQTRPLQFKTREQAVADGYNYAGWTNDGTMLREIRRDYLAQGYSNVVFVKESTSKWHYFTKRSTPDNTPNPNPIN